MNRFPDFNTWHKVPAGAVIPPGTPTLERYGSGNYYYAPEGYLMGISPTETSPTTFTARPIEDPGEAANWKKAEKMYRTAYSSLDDAWEYQSQDTKDRWYTLAKKYDEKED